jgi:hypothetical protein
MLYTLSLALVGQPLPGLIHFSISLLAALTVFSFGTRLVSPRVGLIGAVLFYSAPMVAFQSATSKIELFPAFFVPLSLYAVGIWAESEKRSWLTLAGIFGGLAAGIKITSLIGIFFAFVIVLLIDILKRSSFRKCLFDLLSMLISFLALYAPWLIRDYLWTGNPIFPLFPGNFANQDWPADLIVITEALPLFSFFTLPVQIVTNCGYYCKEMAGVSLGALPLLFLPWLYFWRPFFSKKVRVTLFFAFLFTTLSYLVALYYLRSSRYMIFLLPFMATLAAFNIEAGIKLVEGSRFRRVFWGIGLVVFLGYILATRSVLTVSLWNLTERYPYTVFLGLETPESFLSRSLPVYDALQYLDSQGDGQHKVFSLGNELRGYTNSSIFGPIFSIEARTILKSAASEADLASQLEAHQYDYILVYPGGQERDPFFYTSPYLNQDFFDQFTTLEYAQNTVRIYRFLPEGTSARAGTVNLLENGGFEMSTPEDSPEGWTLVGAPVYDSTGENAFRGISSILVQGPSESLVYQDVDIQEGDLHTIGYWAKPAQPLQDGQVFIEWLDSEKQPIRRSVEWFDLTLGWNHYSFPASAPKKAAFARIYVSLSTEGEAWFDEICFGKGDRCE